MNVDVDVQLCLSVCACPQTASLCQVETCPTALLTFHRDAYKAWPGINLLFSMREKTVWLFGLSSDGFKRGIIRHVSSQADDYSYALCRAVRRTP